MDDATFPEPDTVASWDFASCDALFDKYEEYLEEIITRCLELNRAASERAAAEAPNPFLSSITRGCVARARDRAWRGADWHCVIVEGFGWASVADAMAARVSSQFDAAVSRHSDANLRYLPSYHTLHTHIDAGAKTNATRDGRRQGEPLGKQLAPLPGRNTRGLTGMLLSAQQMREAMADANAHPDLAVRIGGFSMYFRQLSPQVRSEGHGRPRGTGYLRGLC